MTNRLSKEEYNQMALEISGASVPVWDEGLEYTEDGIILETLWPILDKYLKPKEDEQISD